MGWEILEQERGGQRACFYDATTMWAFGPVADDLECFVSPRDTMEAFAAALANTAGDPRSIEPRTLEATWGEWSRAAREFAVGKGTYFGAEDIHSEAMPDGSWLVQLTAEAQQFYDRSR